MHANANAFSVDSTRTLSELAIESWDIDAEPNLALNTLTTTPSEGITGTLRRDDGLWQPVEYTSCGAPIARLVRFLQRLTARGGPPPSASDVLPP